MYKIREASAKSVTYLPSVPMCEMIHVCLLLGESRKVNESDLQTNAVPTSKVLLF